MDSLSGLLARATGNVPVFLLRMHMRAPFAIELADGSPLSIVTSRRSTIHIDHPDGAVELAPGDLALIRGEQRWRLADDAATAVTAIIHPDQRCETISGEPVAERWSLGVRTWGNIDQGDDASHTVMTGTYERIPETGRWLLRELPGVIVLPAHSIDASLLEWFEVEISRDDLGQTVVLERMLDLLLVLGLRHWLASSEHRPIGALRALTDPCIGPAIRLMQADPARPWTVYELARSVGLSRAAFAKRFHATVGTPPIGFVTDWRLAVAADLLADTDASVAQVASDVGYTNSFAFSTAFKRQYGVSPQRHRTRGGTTPSSADEAGETSDLEPLP